MAVAIRVSVVALLYFINLFFWCVLLGILGLFAQLTPFKMCRNYCKRYMEYLPVYWIKCNRLIQKTTLSIEWKVTGLNQLDPNQWYLLIANHQSWVDVLVLQDIFNGKIPTLKFFLKRELLWTLPFASWACWLLGFPFVRRYSKKMLAKHPKLKNKDIEATQHACQNFLANPTTVTNFLEGTRFSKKKQALQKSPYNYLLRPKSTGIGFSLTALGPIFHKILNVTIVYPQSKAGLWYFLSGNIQKITVHIEVLPMTPDWLGDYQNDRLFRVTLQKKLNALWKEKDKLIKEIQG